MNVGKNANKGGGYHGNLQRVTSLAAVILISQWRIKNTKELTLNQNKGVSKRRVGGDEQKEKSCKATPSKPQGQNYVAMA